MAIIFEKIQYGRIPEQGINKGYLETDNWDDFGFKTLFSLTVFNDQGEKIEIGSVKIAYAGQTGGRTEEHFPQQFEVLPEHFFSLGQDADYYKNIVGNLTPELVQNILMALGDVAYNNHRLNLAEHEPSFNTSLLRVINRSSVDHQFRKIIEGGAPLTEYNFYYQKPVDNRYSDITIEFRVTPNTKPPTNIHILIGRNGVGKTTLLNNMVHALLPNKNGINNSGDFYHTELDYYDRNPKKLNGDYFAGVVSVSFSAFDSFQPPKNQPDASAGMRYEYIGLKINEIPHQNTEIKNFTQLRNYFIKSLNHCLTFSAKKLRWINAIRKLEYDSNFADMDLGKLTGIHDHPALNTNSDFVNTVTSMFERLSSGHAIVLLTITKLVETVEEKTLVLIDEPESHLHPPLLSAFTRALSDLLVNRNGVAIIATHSPVVLQEVPKSCVSIIRRIRSEYSVDRPEYETFAENVGVLTREVFGLEVAKSGFHELLSKSVEEGKTYDEILDEYNHQLGFEGKAILRSLIFNRDSTKGVFE